MERTNFDKGGIALDVFLHDALWRTVGKVDLVALEEDDVARLTRREQGEWLLERLQYFRCSELADTQAHDIQEGLAKNDQVFCRIRIDALEGKHRFDMSIRVRELYLCSVETGDFDSKGLPISEHRWMITGIHADVRPQE
jgi:hypothetical protein